MKFRTKFKNVFDLKKENKKRMFIVLVFFLISFSVVHIYSMNFSHYVFISGYHIHHFYFGTAALFLGGILAILDSSSRRMKIAAALIGTGAGLFIDEVGLLLTCTSFDKQCAYVFPDTPDIVMSVTAIIIFLIALADSDLIALKNRLLARKNKSQEISEK